MIKNWFLTAGTLAIFLVGFVPNGAAQPQIADYEDWKGNRFVIQVSDPSDSLSANEITELRGENGLPLWFARDIYKVVCLTGECRMVHLRLYWDGAGNYLGFVTAAKEPLTKTDHQEFSREDYKKLHSILTDSLSVLRSLQQEELIILPEKKSNSYKPDGYTGATRQSLQEYLVKNAAYTCYTLWHTVYGPTRRQILSELDARGEVGYLNKIFAQKDPVYLIWAIHFLSTHPALRKNYEEAITRLVESEKSDLAHHALSWFTPQDLQEQIVQLKMAEAVGKSLSQIKFEIIWKFSKLPVVNNEALLLLLQQYEKNNIYAGLVGYICEMIHPEQLHDSRILHSLKKLSHDKNPYVKDLAKSLVRKKNS